MKIYLSHSSKSDFREELYGPLKESELNSRAEIILPHEKTEAQYDSKAELKTCQWVIAEVSQPSIGVGIELGWADIYQVPIIAVHKVGTARQSSVDRVAKHYLEYTSRGDLVELLVRIIK